jgi:hypothetical protein
MWSFTLQWLHSVPLTELFYVLGLLEIAYMPSRVSLSISHPMKSLGSPKSRTAKSVEISFLKAATASGSPAIQAHPGIKDPPLRYLEPSDRAWEIRYPQYSETPGELRYPGSVLGPQVRHLRRDLDWPLAGPCCGQTHIPPGASPAGPQQHTTALAHALCPTQEGSSPTKAHTTHKIDLFSGRISSRRALNQHPLFVRAVLGVSARPEITPNNAQF